MSEILSNQLNFNEISKPFKIKSVIKSEAIPIDKPNTDKILAVLTKPLL